MESINPKDFLYQRKGPWPQPSPAHPFGESNAVIHLPWREKIDWWFWIGSRYLITLPYAIIMFIKGFINPGLKKVSDEKFKWYFNHSMVTKFLSNEFDDMDKENFAPLLEKYPNKNWYIVDFQAVNVIKPFPEIYVSGTKTLLEKNGSEFIPHAIYIHQTNELLQAKHVDAWELAKYFVLQGAAICSTLVLHPLLHFPMDSINAITKTALPKNHILFQLLYPHLRFTLPLENAVLTYKSSLLQAKWWMPYAPYPGSAEGLRDLLVEGFKGIKGNIQYKPFQYPLSPPENPTSYGKFSQKYFEVIKKFVAEILHEIPEDDFWVLKWGDYVHQHVPAFPTGEQLLKENKLVDAVAMYFFTVTVSHCLDHHNYGKMDKQEIPLRIRQEPPKKGITLKPRSKLCNAFDLMKYDMADILFFSPTVVTKLIDAEYAFRSAENKAAVLSFKKNLKELNQELLREEINYMSIDEISASIQF